MHPTAQVIADSLNLETGDRLTTLLCTYHRFIHPELLTHRSLSRNSASSRGIPTKKLIEKAINEPAMPLFWGKNQSGMQAREELLGEEKEQSIALWNSAREQAIAHAQELMEIGAHKQLVNRVLEPFIPITTIISATEWDNFFDQRVHPDAQPEIQALAEVMKRAIASSTPKQCKFDEWHLPFVTEGQFKAWGQDKSIKVSVGKCARVSYLNHFGIHDPDSDVELFNRLLNQKPPHFSPFEHQASAANKSSYCANFRGWFQFRKRFDFN